MNCLKDYIGIQSGGVSSPLSGIYINSLPGFTLDKIARIRETENADIASLFEEIQSRSWLRLEKDFRRQLRSKFKVKAIKNFAETKQVYDGTIATAAKYKGIVLDLGTTESSFLSFQVNRITVTLASDVSNLQVKLFDGNGTLLDTISKANATVGKNVLRVSKAYPVQKIFAAIDTTNIELQAATLPVETLHRCYACICQVCNTCKPSIYGATADLDKPDQLTKSSYAYGIEIGYTVQCDYSNIICANKPEFTDVWLYLLGSEFMLECMYSTKMNRFTTIDRDRAEELNNYYGGKYDEALEEVIKGLEVKEDDCCIECNPQFTQKEVLP